MVNDQMVNKNFDVIILGSGPAGLTAAIYSARGGLKTLVLTGNQPGGQPTITDVVENFPGFPEGIKGSELMQRVQKQAKKFGAELVMDVVTNVKLANIVHDREVYSPEEFKVKTRRDKIYSAKSIIVATGASPKWLDVPGAEKFKGRGVSVCATCDGPFFKDKTVAVVGGGDTALTEAEFLTKFADKVFVIQRRENLRAQQILQTRINKSSKITVLYNTELKEFLGKDKLEGLRVASQYQVNSDQREQEVKKYPDKYGKAVVDKNGKRSLWALPVDGVFLAIGYTPNTDFLNSFIDLDKKGYIKTKRDVFTSQDGVFAAGDCVDYRYRQNIVACGMGCKAALEASEFLNRNL